VISTKKIFQIIFVILFSTLFVSCGFKKINTEGINSINIKDINILGEKRYSNILKDSINLLSDKESLNEYNIKLFFKKNKIYKIKDKTGSITRYKISFRVELNLEEIKNKIEVKKIFEKNGDYDVADNHTTTINNEKNLTKNLIQQLSEEITNYIILTARN